MQFNTYSSVPLFSFLNIQKNWALQDGTMVIVGGKTNRAKAEFPEEMDCLLDRVPEIVESSRSKEPDKVSGMIDAILNFEVKQRGGLNTITI